MLYERKKEKRREREKNSTPPNHVRSLTCAST
jgi:hypothetical protein